MDANPNPGPITGQYVKPHRWFVIALSVLLAVAVVGTFLGLAAAQNNKTPFAKSKYARNATRGYIKPNQLIDFEFSVRNPTSGMVVLRPVTLPKSLSPKLRLVKDAVIGDPRLPDAVAVGWPPARRHTRSSAQAASRPKISPLDGFHLKSKHAVQILLVFHTSGPGLYKVGPGVTVHADRVGFWKDVPIIGPVSSFSLPSVETACVGLACK